jgi:hypothetical protein
MNLSSDGSSRGPLEEQNLVASKKAAFSELSPGMDPVVPGRFTAAVKFERWNSLKCRESGEISAFSISLKSVETSPVGPMSVFISRVNATGTDALH